MTTAGTSAGVLEKKVCLPTTSSSLSALRLAARFSVRTAMAPRRDTLRQAGNGMGQELQGEGFEVSLMTVNPFSHWNHRRRLAPMTPSCFADSAHRPANGRAIGPNRPPDGRPRPLAPHRPAAGPPRA